MIFTPRYQMNFVHKRRSLLLGHELLTRNHHLQTASGHPTATRLSVGSTEVFCAQLGNLQLIPRLIFSPYAVVEIESCESSFSAGQLSLDHYILSLFPAPSNIGLWKGCLEFYCALFGHSCLAYVNVDQRVHRANGIYVFVTDSRIA